MEPFAETWEEYKEIMESQWCANDFIFHTEPENNGFHGSCQIEEMNKKYQTMVIRWFRGNK
jgi:hypothetical protein